VAAPVLSNLAPDIIDKFDSAFKHTENPAEFPERLAFLRGVLRCVFLGLPKHAFNLPPDPS